MSENSIAIPAFVEVKPDRFKRATDCSLQELRLAAQHTDSIEMLEGIRKAMLALYGVRSFGIE